MNVPMPGSSPVTDSSLCGTDAVTAVTPWPCSEDVDVQLAKANSLCASPPVDGAEDPERRMTSTRPPLPMPQPALSEVIDGAHGTVTASGQLTWLGADLLRGTVEGLRRLGHSTVVIDMADVQAADPAGLSILDQLSTTMASAGDQLLLLHVPPSARVER
jgi:anti-anti-sigma regulatory factor